MTPSDLRIFTPPEIAVAIHFHGRHGTKTTSVFLRRSLLIAPSNFVLLTIRRCSEPENAYSCILKVTGEVWEGQKWISINNNHSFRQRLSP